MNFSVSFQYQNCSPDSFTSSIIYDLTITINRLFSIEFKKLPKPHTIVIDPKFETPQILRDKNRIEIAIEPKYYCQFAYQYCHELCHLMIENEVYSDYRWFEESICELASLYFLPLIGEDWLKRNINCYLDDGRPYALYFNQYAEDTKRNIHKFNLQELSNPNSEISLLLKQDPYCREHNRYVANRLMPYFKSTVTLWPLVPGISSIKKPLPFPCFINSWCHLDNSSTLLKSGISSLFNPENEQM